MFAYVLKIVNLSFDDSKKKNIKKFEIIINIVISMLSFNSSLVVFKLSFLPKFLADIFIIKSGLYILFF